MLTLPGSDANVPDRRRAMHSPALSPFRISIDCMRLEGVGDLIPEDGVDYSGHMRPPGQRKSSCSVRFTATAGVSLSCVIAPTHGYVETSLGARSNNRISDTSVACQPVIQ